MFRKKSADFHDWVRNSQASTRSGRVTEETCEIVKEKKRNKMSWRNNCNGKSPSKLEEWIIEKVYIMKAKYSMVILEWWVIIWRFPWEPMTKVLKVGNCHEGRLQKADAKLSPWLLHWETRRFGGEEETRHWRLLFSFSFFLFS